ncbi:helix-turn-helix domain-containing protein [Butyrivibrio sp. YAB3001]|uniref:helix-turn-helix domain-containing protein n=1 Tax=Butyrivibrio sp. YAB3001 TaxID=1520812 RepID=UPI0008F63D81|nr:helix-turn-helix transcriptional regulator [Butyrivibrio sp. YAB3001]SFC68389.1 DNA-binding transcriptional regulator, XRE-family HTH domain [Butyrivibrio sp. YAB3001]
MVEDVLKDRIRELRKSRNITQAILANDIGVSESTISKWESGNAIPDIEMLCTLSEYFDVSIDELLDRNTLLKRIIKNWQLQNANKQPYSSNTELLGSMVQADDLLIQLVLKKLELSDVIAIIEGSSFAVCDRIFANLSLKVAGFIVDHLPDADLDENEIIRIENKALTIIEDIKTRVSK